MTKIKRKEIMKLRIRTKEEERRYRERQAILEAYIEEEACDAYERWMFEVEEDDE